MQPAFNFALGEDFHLVGQVLYLAVQQTIIRRLHSLREKVLWHGKDGLEAPHELVRHDGLGLVDNAE